MSLQAALGKVIEGESLSRVEMEGAMRQIMTGGADDAQIAGFLVALRMKGESVDEIAGAAQVMRELSSGVSVEGEHIVDIVGTGGDGASIFNVSTAASFVVAAAGGQVAKHGNRSVSSKSGSADLLEAAGVRLDLSSDEVSRCVSEVGLGFMFAVNHHSAMKHAIGPRKSLAQRTVFNLLGPITNPAGVKCQLLGVFSKQWLRPIAEVLKELGSDHVMVVHAADGLDEISVAAETHVVELKNGEIKEYTVTPEQFDISRGDLAQLKVSDADASLSLINAAFSGENDMAADMIALNAGAALYVAGISKNLAEGIEFAQDLIASGQAKEKIKQLADFTQLMKS